MTYSERFSDDERMQTYAELVGQSMAHYPSGEAAVIAEFLSRDHVEPLAATPARLWIDWRSLLRLPLFGLPSLT